MKRVLAKNGIAPVLMAVLTILLFTACILCVPTVKSVSADSPLPTTIELSLDPDKVIAGGTFNLRMKVTSVRADKSWSSGAIRIVTMNESGIADTSLGQYLTYDRASAPAKYVGDDAALVSSKYNNPTVTNELNKDTSRVTVGFAVKSISDLLSTSTPIVIDLPLKISSDFTDSGLTSITFGIVAGASTKIEFNINSGGADNRVVDIAQNAINLNRVTLNIKTPSDDPSLSEIKVGPSDDLQPITLQDTGMTYTYTGSDLTDFAIQPTSTDGASIKVGLTSPATTEVKSGEMQKVTLKPGNNTLYIETVAEDGVTKKTYTITVKVGYVALSALSVTSTTPSTGVTKNGLKDAFAKDTYTYDAYVPSDATVTNISATVEANYGINTTISVRYNNCIASSSLTSGGRMSVYSIGENASVTLTATASDGSTTKVYTVNLVKVSVDTSIDSLTATGVESSTVYNNDSEKATENSLDYFFILNAENGDPKATLTLTLNNQNATAKVENVDYSETTQYALGTYTIEVTAEAGNKKTYQFKLSGPLVIELSLTSKYQFITEVEAEEWGELMYYRRTYAELGWKHGVDDKDLERIVLGQILPSTTIKKFLDNFDSSQYPMIKLYDGYDTLIYDKGQPGPGLSESDLDDEEMYTVGTGWRIDFGKGDTPTEQVYLCVAGDVDGDGMLLSPDSVAILSYLDDLYPLDKIEFRLAAYIMNDGMISSSDSVEILTILDDLSTIESHLYYPEQS